MAKPLKIMMWGREDVILWAVEHFLSTREEWEVIRIPDEQSLDFFNEQINRVNPEVIIIHQGDRLSNDQLALRLMQAHPGTKVITVSLENNLMEVYSKQSVCVKQISDLLSVAKGRPVTAGTVDEGER